VITLHGFGPFFGTPDASPFVIKVMLLLKFAGVPFRTVRGNPLRGPHRMLPYIEDGGVVVADSTLIRLHLERKYQFDFDRGLGAEQRAKAWAIERMCEDHLYFAMLDFRWRDSANFEAGLGGEMFGAIPAPLRPVVKSVLRRMNARRLRGHGIGQLSRTEIALLAVRDVDALAATLGDKPFLAGDQPCAADAFVFGIVTAILTPPLASPIRTALQQHANLNAYCDRMTRRYFSAPPESSCQDDAAAGRRNSAA
jgi:glutathione S-transferase